METDSDGFTVAHDTIELQQQGKLAHKKTKTTQYQVAFCSGHVMNPSKFVPASGSRPGKMLGRGRHSATFTLMSGAAIIGLANVEKLAAGHADIPIRQRMVEAGSACATEHGWGFITLDGSLKHNSQYFDWEGQQGAKQGDEITLSLDFELGGALFISINRGAAMQGHGKAAGLTTPYPEREVYLGKIANGLSGPLVWCAELCNAGSCVSVVLQDEYSSCVTEATAAMVIEDAPCAPEPEMEEAVAASASPGTREPEDAEMLAFEQHDETAKMIIAALGGAHNTTACSFSLSVTRSRACVCARVCDHSHLLREKTYATLLLI